MKTVELPIAPAQTAPWQIALLLVLPLAVLPMAISLYVLWQNAALTPLVTGAVLGLAVAVGIGTIAALRWAMHRSRVEIVGDSLRIRAATYNHQRGINSFDINAAAVIDLDQHPEWKPQWRTNGIGLPGFQAGHFSRWSSPKRRFFCLLTDKRRVLALPGRDGIDVLISLEHPHRALEILRATAGN